MECAEEGSYREKDTRKAVTVTVSYWAVTYAYIVCIVVYTLSIRKERIWQNDDVGFLLANFR